MVVRDAGLARVDDRVVGRAVAEPADADEVHPRVDRTGRGAAYHQRERRDERCETESHGSEDSYAPE